MKNIMTTSLSSQSPVLILGHKVWDTQITLVSIASVMDRSFMGTAKELVFKYCMYSEADSLSTSLGAPEQCNEYTSFEFKSLLSER